MHKPLTKTDHPERLGGGQLNEYDDAGRVETIVAPTGTITRSYFAPEDTAIGQAPGKLSALSGPYATQLSYSYDGQLTTSEVLTGDVAGTVEWTYNDDFVVTEQTVTAPGGLASTAFAYDADLLMTCASPTTCPSGADALTLTRSPSHGMVTQLSQGNVTETWSYSQYAELSGQTSTYAGSPLLNISYARDALGRITTKTEVRSGATKVYGYTYDDQGRLETVTLDGVVIEEFTYDANGNRLSAYTQGEGTITGVYDDQDRLISYGDFSYTYTENGELSTKLDTVTGDQWDYTYDVFGNLLSVALPDGRFVEYLTDGRHRRVGKKVDGVMVRQWVFEDQLNPVAELDGNGDLLWHYAYGSKEHSPDYAANAAGDVYRVISDQLGSPRLIVNVDDDTVLLEAEYSAFGERTVISGDGTALSLGFAGGELDHDTGLTRFGARDYDPVIGRWVAKDSIRFAGDGPNLYVYVTNDPVNGTDPSGLQSQGCGDEDCFVRCMNELGADIAMDFVVSVAAFAPTLKSSYEMGRTLAGGSSLTTWGSRLSSALGMAARNGLRTVSARAARVVAVPYSAAVGYLAGATAACTAECGM